MRLLFLAIISALLGSISARGAELFTPVYEGRVEISTAQGSLRQISEAGIIRGHVSGKPVLLVSLDQKDVVMEVVAVKTTRCGSTHYSAESRDGLTLELSESGSFGVRCLRASHGVQWRGSLTTSDGSLSFSGAPNVQDSILFGQ